MDEKQTSLLEHPYPPARVVGNLVLASGALGVDATGQAVAAPEASIRAALDVLAERLATVAIGDRQRAAATWQWVRDERARLARELDRLGLKSLPSQSNFLLVQISKKSM